MLTYFLLGSINYYLWSKFKEFIDRFLIFILSILEISYK
jgi:hypothetical protein